LWRTRDPVTFNDKVRYKLLRDHRQLVVDFADKATMRDYVSRVVGPGHLPGLVALADSAAELTDAVLAGELVLKPTHGSGACVVVDERAPAAATLPPAVHGWVYSHVRPDAANPQGLRDIAAGWLTETYGRGPNHEWAYGRIRPRLLVEELLRGVDGSVPDDYKLFVFHGRCRFVEVDGGRFGRRTQDFFDRDGERLELNGGHPSGHDALPEPARLQEMLSLAEALGAETDFVRVDLYALPDRLLVGELTSSPAGGDSPFFPESWNAVFGETWRPPRRYR
jgi:hypothetical protein